MHWLKWLYNLKYHKSAGFFCHPITHLESLSGYGSYRCSVFSFPVSVCDCRRSCMVVLCVRDRETCAIRLTFADRRCCYYCVSVCLIIMSNTSTVEKKTKSNTQHSPTIRIHVELFEPTENRYPVFNYQKLIHIEEVSEL